MFYFSARMTFAAPGPATRPSSMDAWSPTRTLTPAWLRLLKGTIITVTVTRDTSSRALRLQAQCRPGSITPWQGSQAGLQIRSM